MVLVGKMPALKVIKFHNSQNVAFGTHGWKFLSKGLAYLAKNGRKLDKIQFDQICTNNWASEYIYQSLKCLPDLQVMSFRNC